MVVRVGGSFAYLSGDGILTFDDHVRTVGELRQAIEEATNIPGVKQRIFTSGGRLCDDDSALLEAHKENPDGGHKMFMIVDEHVEERKASEARRREKKGDRDTSTSTSSLASHPDAPRREGCTVN